MTLQWLEKSIAQPGLKRYNENGDRTVRKKMKKELTNIIKQYCS